ncbi:RHS repeat protein [Lysobacter niastensis]|uniref:RHS repeat protein n=2 Tax=Lysobacter niastensis TaxID=380629 RepID=A0ABS0B804_9GAMM|nr:RHS repeat protein [Lysobacter niastensis]
MKTFCWALAALLGIAASPAWSQDDAKQPWEEYDKLIKNRESIAVLGPALLGDQVNLMNGALSFSTTDVSVSGNSVALPMALTRTYTVSNRKGYRVNDLPMADWDLDIPRISGVFGAGGENDGFGTPCTASTPAQARPPQLHIGSSMFPPEDYWQGNQASMPGGGEMLLASSGAPSPSSGGPYYWMTSEFTYFSCLAKIKNGGGEGFLAISKDGTKYWFDWMASYQEPDLKSGAGGGDVILRRKRVLYVSRVQDRFGNWLTYTYANAAAAPVRLTRMDASDGRAMSLTYNALGQVATVSNGAQTWTYQYTYQSIGKGSLSAVILPDQSRWTIAFAALTDAKIRYEKPFCRPAGLGQICDPVRSCGDPGIVITAGAFGTITHPSGATGEFTVEPTRHGRSNVPMLCSGYTSPYNDPNDDTAYYPLNYDALSVVKKRVTGPALAPAEWTYSYSSDATFAPGTGPVCTTSNCGAVVCTSDSCAGKAMTVLAGPDGVWERHTFGNSYRYNEGKLLKVETGNGPDAILKTEVSTYDLAQSGRPYATPIGTSPQPRGDGFTSEYLRPQSGKAITQDEVAFDQAVTGFDAFARATSTRRASSLGYSKTDATAYYDDLSKWVIGQVRQQVDVEQGKVMAQTDYEPASVLPIREFRFGKLQQTLGYNTDGTVATVKDGAEHTTELTGWYRGVPRQIRHADGRLESAQVNSLGWITATTDENGYTTAYTYDAMGRLATIKPPAGDVPAGATTVLSFQSIPTTAWDLPVGSWLRTTITGRYRKEQYFDALWRPVFEIERDIGDSAAAPRYRSRSYDADGRETFASYPSDTANAYNSLVQGVRTRYDALGRVTHVEQDSELGPLLTRTEYLPGFERRITNPRGHPVLQRFQVYDEPSYDALIGQDAPEGASTTIARDRYLKPLEVSRSGPGG